MLLNNLLKIHTSSAPSERVFSRAKLADSTAPEMEPSPSTFGGVCHAEAHNYKYLDSKRAVCITACLICISDSVSVSVGVIKSLRIRFVGGEVLYLLICSVR